jgi:hypothetical protein
MCGDFLGGAARSVHLGKAVPAGPSKTSERAADRTEAIAFSNDVQGIATYYHVHISLSENETIIPLSFCKRRGRPAKKKVKV